VEKADPESIVVCDTGPLLHLDQLDSLALLADMGRVVAPVAVVEEVLHHRPGVLTSKHLRLEQVMVKAPLAGKVSAIVQGFSLDAGEREALCLISEHSTAMFLTDDAAARLAGTLLGYEVHGTIGILVRAIKRGLRTADEVMGLLAEIPRRSTLYIRPALLQEIIESVKASRSDLD
jgi:predicted nucleic acid-binding protein